MSSAIDTFFEKFGPLADHAEHVENLRGLVLRLAMDGRLSTPESTDEPIEKVLNQIALGRVKSKGNKALSPIASEEVEFEIPPHWRLVRFGSIADHNAGKTLDKGRNTGELRDYITTSNLYWGRFQLDDLRQMPIREEELERCTARKGDLLICEGGEAGRAAVWPHDHEVSFQNHVHRARPLGRINPHFLYRYFEKLNATGEISKFRKGVGISNMSGKALASIPIPLPPLAEQKRIVAKVDALMAQCDRLEEQLRERDTRQAALARAALARFSEAPTPANLNLLFHDSYTLTPADLRKTILTLAVQGKLVPQDPEDEPAARLLERIDVAPKRAMRTRNANDEDGDEMTEFKPLYELPPGWEWTSFRRLPLQASVGIDRGRSLQGPDKAVGYFKMNNIRNSGGVDLSDLTRIDAKADEIESFALEDGDFLFNTRNSRELVGKTCVFRHASGEPILYNNNILRVKFIDGFSPDFLDYWFRSPQGREELDKLKSNTTNVCAIYQGKLACFPCCIPPLAEQRRIVAKVDQLMALVDEWETRLTATRTTANQLLDALVAQLITKA